MSWTASIRWGLNRELMLSFGRRNTGLQSQKPLYMKYPPVLIA
jgi:hypothetical protein